MILKDIDLHGGKMMFNEFNINPYRPFKNQWFNLNEDLVQIQYKNCLVDLGWRPMLNPKGHFILRVIKNFDWQNPLYLIKFKSIFRVRQYLSNAIAMAKKYEA